MNKKVACKVIYKYFVSKFKLFSSEKPCFYLLIKCFVLKKKIMAIYMLMNFDWISKKIFSFDNFLDAVFLVNTKTEIDWYSKWVEIKVQTS